MAFLCPITFAKEEEFLKEKKLNLSEYTMQKQNSSSGRKTHGALHHPFHLVILCARGPNRERKSLDFFFCVGLGLLHSYSKTTRRTSQGN